MAKFERMGTPAPPMTPASPPVVPFDDPEGRQAIAQLDGGQRIDVIITDIQLWDAAEKSRAARSDVTEVYMSGNSVDDARKVSGNVLFREPCRTTDACTAIGPSH
jgi:hypothetical protein